MESKKHASANPIDVGGLDDGLQGDRI